MSHQEPVQVQIIDERYRQCRADGMPGWTDERSYRDKTIRIEAFLHRNRIHPPASFLELGCGAGNLALEAARRGLTACGIEQSVEAVAWARENALRQGLPVEILHGSAITLEPLDSHSIDVAYDGDCSWMILPPFRCECFINVCRVLKPGGYFFAESHVLRENMTTRFETAPGTYFDPATRCAYLHDVPLYHFDEEGELEQDLAVAGFEILRRIRRPLRTPDPAAPYIAASLYVDARRPLR